MWWLLLLQIGFQILSGFLNKKPGPKPEEKPQLPHNDPSKPIPVPFGECLIEGSTLLDYMDYKWVAIKVRNPQTLWLTKVIVGYKYYLGMIFGVCWGHTPQGTEGAVLKKIYIDKRQIWGEDLPGVDDDGIIIQSGSAPFNQQTPVTIYKPTFFGPEKQEGGICAHGVWYNGDDFTDLDIPMEQDPYWESEAIKRLAGTTLPHYKDLCYFAWYGPSYGNEDVFHGGKLIGWIGNRNAVWPLAFQVIRQPIILTDGVKARVSTTLGDSATGRHANPIECLCEAFTNENWGAGIQLEKLDLTTWTAAATTCWTERLAFSYLWTSASPVEELIAEILRHVNGSIWTDLASGLIKIKLSRPDYNLEDLPTLGVADFIEISSFTKGSFAETKGEFRVTFPDHGKENFENDTAYWQELANVQARGFADAAEVTYNGCPNMELAARLAARDGRVQATPLTRLTGKIDRAAWEYHPGKVFKLDFPDEGISGLVMRVNDVKLGTVLDPAITISAIQDIFAVGEETYGTTNTTVWTDPLEGDAADANAVVAEMPYFYQRDDLQRVMLLAERPSALHGAYDAVQDGEIDITGADFTPVGRIVSDYPQLSTTEFDETGQLILNNLTDADVVEAATAGAVSDNAANVILVGDPEGDHELMAFEQFDWDEDAGTLTLNNVWRGVLDSSPLPWAAGTQVWFMTEAGARFKSPVADGITTTLEALTTVPRGQLSRAAATDHAITPQKRARRPLPPRDVKLGGSYTNLRQDSGDLVFTWLESNRLTQIQVLKQDAATITPEAGVEYEVEVYDVDDNLIHTESGLTSPAWTYTNADEVIDAGALQARLTFYFYAVNTTTSLRSLLPFVREVYRVDPDFFGDGAWILPPQGFGDVRATVDVPGWDELGVEVYWS